MNPYVSYFLAFPQGDMSKITVIDIMDIMSYERSEFANVNENTYYKLKDAIEAGRDIARRHNLTYIPFESRYYNMKECNYLY